MAEAGAASATVTFLFTDVEGSTRRWEAEREAMSSALARHDALMRRAIEAHGGHVFKTVGDAFCAAFDAAPDALAAAADAQRALAAEPWPDVAGAGGALRVRMAVHTGLVERRDDDYFGTALSRVARLMAAGHGGQVLVSRTARDLAHDDLPAPLGLVDLGEHRLRDLARGEHVFQLAAPGLERDFPPLRTLDAHRHNLPVQLTTFIGRGDEVAAARRTLDEHRLVTLTGVGGTGKSRLALQVAGEVLDAFPDGVWLVELAPLADPALVPQTVAAALAVREVPGRDPADTLVDALRPKRLLVVLDNCEHVLDAAAHLADALLRAAPDVRILATSRAPLGLAGEARLRVDPLRTAPAEPEPDLGILGQYEAVQLFVERAAAVRADFAITRANAAAVAAICHRLDGIPLALELAAARIPALGPEQILARLDERFRLLTGGHRTALPRQQTLRAAIDWSYDLLGERERRVLERLAAFAGGFTLDAAESVCAGGAVDAWDVVDALALLAGQSLVVVGDDGGAARYRLLETIRQYAQARLAESGDEAATRDRHLAWAAELLGETEAHLLDDDPIAWMLHLERHHNDLRAALAWALDDPERLGAALGQCRALYRFWGYRGHFREGRAVADRLEAAAAASPRPAHDAGLAWAAFGRAFLDLTMGELDGLEDALRTIRRRFEAHGDACGAGIAVYTEASVRLERGDLEGAERLADESLAILRASGEAFDELMVVNLLGELARTRGEWDEAAGRYAACLSPSATTADRAALVDLWPLHNLGWIELHRGNEEAAEARFAACLGASHRLGVPGQLAGALVGLAAVAHARGDDRRGAILLAAADRVMNEFAYAPTSLDRADYDRVASLVRAALPPDAWADARSEGSALPAEAAVRLAREPLHTARPVPHAAPPHPSKESLP